MTREKTPQGAPWYAYLARCADGSLYAGITRDLGKRIAEHNGEGEPGRGARYTSGRRPVELAWSEAFATRSEAASREWELKHMSVARKRALAAGTG